MKKPKSAFSWKNRERDLRDTLRYHKFEVMFYRTDLALHSDRVQAIVKRLLPFALKAYPLLDPTKAVLISKFHDDHEMASERGDVPLQLKLLMSKEEQEDLDQEEYVAAEFLIDAYGNPKIQGYSYRDLVMHALKKDCPEAQLHSFADKIDGYCEALHEALVGSVCFVEPVINYVARTFNDLQNRFPLIAKVFEQPEDLFDFPVIGLTPHWNAGLMNGRLHTPTSVVQETGIPHYDAWRKITLELPNGMAYLTERTEPQPIRALHLEEEPAPPTIPISRKAAVRSRILKPPSRSIA